MRLDAKIALLAMVFSMNGWAQSTITGMVRDIETGQPLAGAHLVLEHSGRPSVSDENGNFSLEIESSDDQTLTVSFVGYETLQVSMSPTTSSTLLIDMVPSLVLEEIVVKSIRADESNPVNS